MNADAPANNSVIQLQRLPDGKFAPGSGGRPKGARNKISSAAIAAIKDMSDDALAKLKERVMASDLQAIMYVLDRVLPKGRSVEFNDVTPDGIAQLLADGLITSGEAKDVATALKALADVGKLAELEERLAELETALAERK